MVADAGFVDVQTGSRTAIWEFDSREACTRFLRDVAPPRPHLASPDRTRPTNSATPCRVLRRPGRALGATRPSPPPGGDERAGAASTAAPPRGYGKDATPPSDRQALLAALERVTEEYHPAALELFERMTQHRPATPHHYLALLATRPDCQGQGLGSALLGPVLARSDREGVPAYTESSNPRNIRLYERHGFGVVDELTLPDGPPLWPMWREPRVEESPS